MPASESGARFGRGCRGILVIFNSFVLIRRGRSATGAYRPGERSLLVLLSITTTHQPATDLGFLLRKNPERLHTFELSFGNAHVFYPEATDERCTAALLLEIDPIGLVRGRKRTAGYDPGLQQYVN